MARIGVLVAVLGLGMAAMPPAPRAEAEGEPAAGVEAKAVLERLKTLAGTWSFEGAPEGAGDARVTYRVTAAGSAVIEDQFPGSDHEMVSIYHLDGDDLVMTHYCAVGNQPRLRLDRAKSTPDELHFAFDGGTNFDPASDIHIHEAVLRLGQTAEGKLTSDWTAHQDGKPVGTTTFELVRE